MTRASAISSTAMSFAKVAADEHCRLHAMMASRTVREQVERLQGMPAFSRDERAMAALHEAVEALDRVFNLVGKSRLG